MKYSIIIPTYNEVALLHRCLWHLKQFTDLTDSEVIVVCNGCKDESPHIVPAFGSNFKCIYWDKPLGFAKAVNIGLSCSTGDYVVLMNNDSYVTGNNWLSMLEQPFKDHPKSGLSGPALQRVEGVPYTNLIFFCVMIKREVIKAIGYLDETFGVGEAEDWDFCIKAQLAGFELYEVPYNQKLSFDSQVSMITGSFPIVHDSFATRSKIPDIESIMKKNNALLCERYNMKF